MTALHAQGLLTLRFAYHLFIQKPKEELHDFRTWTTMTRTRSGCSGGCMRSTPCPCSPRGISICIIWGSTGEERGGQSRLAMLHKAQKCRTGTLPTQQSGARWESHAALLPAKAIMEKMGLREEGLMPNNM